MYHNYFFLKRLAEELDEKLVGTELIESFSQNKDELILGLADANKSVFVQANLDSKVCLLQFIDDFKRARRNSVDLFNSLIGKKVSTVKAFDFDRSFAIQFDSGQMLVFKMHGSRSNILLCRNDTVQELFKGSLQNDTSLIPSQLSKPEATKETFENTDGNIAKVLPALGREVNQRYFDEEYLELTMEEKWDHFQNVIYLLHTYPITILDKESGYPELSLLHPKDAEQEQYDSAIAASNALYQRFTRKLYLDQVKNQLLKETEDKIRKTKNYIANTTGKLQQVKNRRSYEEIANIIMANLHRFQAGEREVELDDFYSGKKLMVKFKPNITAQKHAEQLYRKSKNQKKELDQLEENLQSKKDLLAALEEKKSFIDENENTKELRKLVKERKVKQDAWVPYHLFSESGYDILVGKNAKSNDELTTRYAGKNDLWLHAKDVAGSHVVIRNHGGKVIPKNVIEKAAELAAWFSKRKNDSLCPVIYTERKFVRKPKGLAPGQVRVDREQVVLVTPKKPE